MTLTHAVVFVLLGVGQVSSMAAVPKVGEEDFAKLKAQTGIEGGTKEGMAYLKASAKALETAINAAFGQCTAELTTDKTPGFEFIARIGKDGAVQEVVIQPDDAFTACYAKAFGATKLGVPPGDPFHIYVGMQAKY